MNAPRIEVICNGEPRALCGGRTLAELLPELTEACDFAVAVNGEFVPKSAYGQVRLADGDRLELVVPMEGG
ncbi:MAG: sulfur carrier protein ThiS [Pseudomonadota bacterium]